jgi:signal transduction histidine kinase
MQAPASEWLKLDATRLIVLGTAGLVLSCGAAAISLTGSEPDQVAFAVGLAMSIAVPSAVGLYAWRAHVHERFGALLLLLGLCSFLPALSSSSNDLVYSFGRVAVWLNAITLIYLLLIFPTGRLPGRPDRTLVWAGVTLVAVLYLPTALLVDQYPLPTTWTACRDGCPDNAFMLLDSQPGFVDTAIVPLREGLTVALFAAVLWRLAYRIRHATPLMRRTLSPVLAFAIVTTLAFVFAISIRAADRGSPLVTFVAETIVLGLPLMAVGFLLGLFRWRLCVASALQRLALDVRQHPRKGELRDVIADALSDPSVELAFSTGSRDRRWVDTSGSTVPRPMTRADRHVTETRGADGHMVAIVHDRALQDQQPFVEAVGTYVLTEHENQRLAANVETSLQDLAGSRARILAAADEERRRIERDLHDGAQQRLVALGIRLGLAEDEMQRDPKRAKDMIHELRAEVTDALEDVRSLAKGVYPSVLTDRGLADALATIARRAPMPVTVKVEGKDRYAQDVEAAAYFCCLEALQNAAKYAADATAVSVSLYRNGDLRFEVRDNGPGFSESEAIAGHGLLNMRDRVAAVGGKLDIRSVPGEGTRVVGTVPVR